MMLPQWRRTIWPFTWWATLLIVAVGAPAVFGAFWAVLKVVVFVGRIVVKVFG